MSGMNEDKDITPKTENSLIPIAEDKKIQLALGIYTDGKRKILNLPTEDSQPDVFPGFTEEARKSLVLQGQRLKKLGLRMESKEEWLVLTDQEERVQRKPKRISDGPCGYEVWGNWLNILTIFEKENQEIVGSFRDRYFTEFELIETSRESLRVVSEMKQAKEEIFGCKSEYWDETKWTLEKLGVGLYVGGFAALALTNTGSLLVWILSLILKDVFSANVFGTAFYVWLISMVGVLPLWSYCKGLVPSFKRRRASVKVVQRIREAIPGFCRADFVSMAESRIKALLFTDTFSQVGEFVSGDVSEFLRIFSHAINYESQNFWFLGFWQDVDCQHIEVLTEALVTEELGTCIGRGKKYIRVHFIKPLQGIMDSEWYVEKIEAVNKNGK